MENPEIGEFRCPQERIGGLNLYMAKYLPEFDVLHRSVSMRCRLITKAPLHVGSGEVKAKPTGIDSPFVKTTVRGEERIYLPGSSLRGVLRAAVENSLKSKNPEYACNPFGKENEKNPDCEACSLFGSTKRGAVVEIKDLIPPEQLRTEMRTGIGIDRDTGAVHHGALFTFECVSPGVDFPIAVTFDNPANYQLGLFAMGVQALNFGVVRVGGMKSRGLGEVEIKLEKVEFRFPFASVKNSEIVKNDKLMAEVRKGELVVSPIKEDSDAQLKLVGVPSLRSDGVYAVAEVENPDLRNLIACAEEVL